MGEAAASNSGDILKYLRKLTIVRNYLSILVYLLVGYLLKFIALQTFQVRSLYGYVICFLLVFAFSSIIFGIYAILQPSKFLGNRYGELTKKHFARYFSIVQNVPGNLQAISLGIFLFTMNYLLLVILLILSIPIIHFVYLRNQAIVKKHTALEESWA